MFIGHYGIGFALKKAELRLSLGLLISGAILLDILFGVFLFAGVEHAIDTTTPQPALIISLFIFSCA